MDQPTFDRQLAACIDHTLLKPEAQEHDIRRLCAEARQYGFASVCVNPSWVRLCSELLDGAPSRVCTVIGFPLGSNTSDTKVFETLRAAVDGAREFDMVIDIGRLRQGDTEAVRLDIAAVAEAVTSVGQDALLKVILETCLLEEAQIRHACDLCVDAGAHFVKTSTGFSSGGATVEAVRLMRATVGPATGVKASGGIRDTETARAMLAAGANRIGASASIAIVSSR
ncbi:MAG: deoxyribose-phosphate aldolase [Bacteroidetes bacterium]|nr:deoxyribose-phosphate aldolase [Bacteroidota bacterium]